MKTIRNLYRMLCLMWLLTQMCYRVATNATNSAALAHQRINSVITTVGGIHSGSVTAGMAEGLDVGNGPVSSLFTGSSSIGPNAGSPPTQTGYDAASAPATYNQADMTAYANHINFNVADITAILNYLSAFASTYNTSIGVIAYIQSELQAHGFSST
jgi:hypothetical protein